MKRLLLILSVNFIIFSTALSTEQIPDILIIGNETVYLKSFPLEQLITKNKFKEIPFDYGEYSFPSTACWRGYVATWQVIDDTLVLKRVEKLDSANTQLNIIEYLENNGYNPKTKKGYVIADWYSEILKQYRYNYQYDRYYVAKDYSWGRANLKIELVFENGKLIENNIIPISDYKIGDNLYFDVYYFQDWYIWISQKNAQIKGIIKENDGKRVKLEIVSFGTEKERIIRKIQKQLKYYLDDFWINPRYCERN